MTYFSYYIMETIKKAYRKGTEERMKKRYRLRYDRVMIVAALTVLLITAILLLSHGCSKKEQKTKVVPEAVQAEVTTALAEAEYTTAAEATTTALAETTVTTTAAQLIPQIEYPECKASALYDVKEKKLLYGDSIDMQIAPASLTKLITASVALKYSEMSEVYTVGSEQWLVNEYSSVCGVVQGNMATLGDLITGMLMESGNDAAYTIAVSIARESSGNENMSDTEAVNYFCGLMNSFAKELGMTGTHFVNPDGWDADGQYTTVADLLKIAEYVLSVPQLREIVGTYQKTVTFYTGESFTWTNSNLLLDPYSEYYRSDAIGMKTGTTLNAGNSLIAAFEKNGKEYITVVAGCLTDEMRFELTHKLISYTDEN